MNGPVTSMQLVVEDFTFKYADYVLDPIVPWFTYGILLPNGRYDYTAQKNCRNTFIDITQ